VKQLVAHKLRRHFVWLFKLIQIFCSLSCAFLVGLNRASKPHYLFCKETYLRTWSNPSPPSAQLAIDGNDSCLLPPWTKFLVGCAEILCFAHILLRTTGVFAEIWLSASHLVDKSHSFVQTSGESCPCTGKFEHRVSCLLVSARKKS